MIMGWQIDYVFKAPHVSSVFLSNLMKIATYRFIKFEILTTGSNMLDPNLRNVAMRCFVWNVNCLCDSIDKIYNYKSKSKNVPSIVGFEPTIRETVDLCFGTRNSNVIKNISIGLYSTTQDTNDRNLSIADIQQSVFRKNWIIFDFPQYVADEDYSLHKANPGLLTTENNLTNDGKNVAEDIFEDIENGFSCNLIHSINRSLLEILNTMACSTSVLATPKLVKLVHIIGKVFDSSSKEFEMKNDSALKETDRIISANLCYKFSKDSFFDSDAFLVINEYLYSIPERVIFKFYFSMATQENVSGLCLTVSLQSSTFRTIQVKRMVELKLTTKIKTIPKDENELCNLKPMDEFKENGAKPGMVDYIYGGISKIFGSRGASVQKTENGNNESKKRKPDSDLSGSEHGSKRQKVDE